MAANALSRETMRDALQGILAAALVPTTAQAVTNYLPRKVSGQPIPLVCVFSDGSQRAQAAVGSTRYANRFRLGVMTFVYAADTQRGQTEQAAEDQLDAIEKKIADTIADNRGKVQSGTLPWNYIQIEDGSFSSIQPATIDGVGYVVETFNIIVEAKDTV